MITNQLYIYWVFHHFKHSELESKTSSSSRGLLVDLRKCLFPEGFDGGKLKPQSFLHYCQLFLHFSLKKNNTYFQVCFDHGLIHTMQSLELELGGIQYFKV